MYLLTILEAVSKIRVLVWVGFFWDFSSWLSDGPLPTLFSHGLSSECICLGVSLCSNLLPQGRLDEGPPEGSCFWENYLFKVLSPSTVTFCGTGAWDFNIRIVKGHNSLHNNPSLFKIKSRGIILKITLI